MSSAAIQESDEEFELGEETDCPKDATPFLMHLVWQRQGVEAERILYSLLKITGVLKYGNEFSRAA